MLTAAAKPFVNLVEKYLPDPFVFVLALTLLVMGSAVVVQQQPVTLVIEYWGGGFWSLLTFSMQMLLVLVSGHMLASTVVVKKALNNLARLAATPGKAIILVTLISMLASWLNWGFGLVVGALFAKAIARRIEVDYRLLVASAYSGFVVWTLSTQSLFWSLSSFGPLVLPGPAPWTCRGFARSQSFPAAVLSVWVLGVGHGRHGKP